MTRFARSFGTVPLHRQVKILPHVLSNPLHPALDSIDNVDLMVMMICERLQHPWDEGVQSYRHETAVPSCNRGCSSANISEAYSTVLKNEA